ncbi:uncharacterized protein LOC103857499 [Brassica rapa]|uniref:Uncharacterized protein n=1 Tax=Brassica campestris TaxID=3711 RepID=M4E2E8_BRACM|nr:uncharacterized protein LOC103857499 [Brassica rapa]XP_018512572.1 uncharacterized protein LOC103857499 [Brassica rapa]XP_033144102.1 uncharacterized protein LOC103857499 [Brassica rapa]
MNLEKFREYLHKVIRNVEVPDPVRSVSPAVIFVATVDLFEGFEMMWGSQRRINVPPPEDDANLLTFLTSRATIVPEHIHSDELASILRYIDGPYLESFTAALKEKATTKEADKSIGRQLCDYAIKFCYYFPNSALSSDQVETESGSSAMYPSDSDATSHGLGLAVEDEDEFEEEEDEKEPVLKDEPNLAEVKEEPHLVEVKEELKLVEVKEELVEVKEEPVDLVKEANRKRHASASPTSSLGST